MKNYLFIGGAPRSGTSLIQMLLDGHPQLLNFPKEHKTFEKYFSKKDRVYFSNEFITKRTEGKQASVANYNFDLDDNRRASNELDMKGRILPIDHSLFYKSYVENMSNLENEFSLKLILDSLSKALLGSNAKMFGKSDKYEYSVFKQPFFTEVHSQQIAKEIPQAKFIYICRNPIDRYVSAKKRRLKQSKIKGKQKLHLNRHSHVLGHFQIGSASYYIAKQNQLAIGEVNYKIIYFEDLIQNPEGIMSELANWLNIEYSDLLLMPTAMNNKAQGGGSFKQYEGGVDEEVLKKKSNRLKEIESAEEIMLNYLLNKSQIAEIYKTSKPSLFQFIKAYLIQLQNESLKEYMFRLADIRTLLYLDFYLHSEAIKKAKLNKLGITGAT